MKKFDKIFITCIIAFILAVIGINTFITTKEFEYSGREYKVALNRVEKAISAYEYKNKNAPESLSVLEQSEELSQYDCLIGLEYVKMSENTNDKIYIEDLVKAETEDYHIFVTEGYIYKITYASNTEEKNIILVYVNIIAAIFLVGLLFVYLYIRENIIKPFNKLQTVPYELAKGNMNMPLEENKNKFFGKFVWGMDLLRENLEENKTKELELQKERKMLLLSLSHDIKTPLSAIKLYSKALSKKLYQSEEKRDEILVNISEKVDEIEKYISEIVKASKEDFLHFEVENDEFYIKDVLSQIKEYYEEKMALNQIAFHMGEYSNSLVYGDKNRVVEVIQNIIENAIKYGDGKKIWLEMKKDEEAYYIKISNTGCTLPERELPHIFDSFFRGTNVKKQPGSGLGLYICRSLMHLMEGEITSQLQQINGTEKSVISLEITLKIA